MTSTTVVLFPNFGGEELHQKAAKSFPGKERLVAGFQAAVDKTPAHGLVAWWNGADAANEAARLGMRLFGAPPDVVARVHDKAFCTDVCLQHGLYTPALARAVHVVSPGDSMRAFVSACANKGSIPPHPGVLKPRFGTAGRGRVPTAALTDRAWQKLLNRGGAVFEPWLLRTADVSSQWWLSDDGAHLTGCTLQDIDAQGLYRGCTFVMDVDGTATSGLADEDVFVAHSRVVVEAAHAAGYRGPCGVDGFAYTDDDGERQMRVCELNARFTVGMIALATAPRGVDGVHRFRLTERA
jgi:carbamoylphosphate synthase large subunit